jgi:hypothetical protein
MADLLEVQWVFHHCYPMVLKVLFEMVRLLRESL